MSQELLLGGLAVLAAGAATVTDLRRNKIPNWLTLPLLALGPALHLAWSGGAGLANSLLGAAAVSAALLGLGLLLGRGPGGGDVKLLVALGALLGWPAAGWLLLYTGASGLLVAVAFLLRRGRLREVCAGLAARPFGPPASGLRVPYAGCILLGAAGVALRALLA